MRNPKNRATFAAVLLLLDVLARAAAAPDGKAETVIVPYDSTKPLDAQKPDQFYLPYERFLQLWEAAKQNRKGPAPELASALFILSAARYDGVVGEHSAAFTGKLDLTTYNDPWIKVPMSFKGVKIGALKIDGATAAFDGDHIVVEKPGRHSVEVSFEIPFRPGVTNLAWGIPRTSATLIALTLPDERTEAVISPGSGVIERIENGHSIVTAAIGSTEQVRVDFRPSATVRVTEPAVAAIATNVIVRPGVEEAETRYTFAFPGGRQDRFKVYLENGLTLFGLNAVNLKTWKLSPEAGRQALEITLNEPAKEEFGFSIQAQRASPAPPSERTVPVFSAAAKRLDYTSTAVFVDDRLEVTLKPAPGQRQVPWDGAGCANGRLAAAYAGNGKLAYSVKVAASRREARVDYVYQVNRRKIELLASLQLFAKGDDLSMLTLTLPAQFEVQAVQSERLQDWWRDANTLHLRFSGGTPEMTPLVVYLMRQYAAAPTELDVRPLALEGFKSVTGEAVIAAHKGVDVTMKLTAEGSEIAAAKAATDFQILPPLERKRGFTFKTQKFAAEIALTALPARMNALWVMHAQAHEGWLALSTHARLTVRQGSVDRASFSLPKTAPEARISGDEVRETRSHIEGDRRIYEVQFQNDVYESVEFTLDFELPDSEEAELPAIAFPEAQMTSGYVLTENVSEYEIGLKTSGVDPSPTTEIPFLPELTKGAGIFRVQPGWSVRIGLDRLEKAASRAAFVAWAEMTSSLRSDGTEWHRASYRLQNRSLQFLPVRMPAGAELMSVRVAGQNVRADTGQVEGVETLLVPLIKTKPGDLSYDVELVYRLAGAVPGWRATKKFAEPELPGITVERTLWNVWLPDNRKLENSGGNMEPVLGDLNKTEKLEGKLQELKQLVTIANSSRASDEARSNARKNLGLLKQELEAENRDQNFLETNGYGSRGVTPKPTPGDEVVGKKALAQQGEYVVSKRKALNEELGREVQKLTEVQPNAPPPPPAQGVLNQTLTITANGNGANNISANGNAVNNSTANWTSNTYFAGNAAPAATSAPADAKTGGNLFLNDNVVLRKIGVGQLILKGGVAQDTTRGGAPAHPQSAAKPTANESLKQNDDDGKDVVFQTARGNNLYYKQQEKAAQQGQVALSQAPQPAAIPSAPMAGAPAAMAMPGLEPIPPSTLQAPAADLKPAMAAAAIPQPNQTVTMGSGAITFTTPTSNGVTAGNTTFSGTLNTVSGTSLPATPGTVTISDGTTITVPRDGANMGAEHMPGVNNVFFGTNVGPAAAAAKVASAEETAKSEAARLQPTGRISLAVDFPTEGQLYHFKKVKANAQLELTVMNSSALTRWWNLAIAIILAGLLYGFGRLLEWRASARRFRSA